MPVLELVPDSSLRQLENNNILYNLPKFTSDRKFTTRANTFGICVCRNINLETTARNAVPGVSPGRG